MTIKVPERGQLSRINGMKQKPAAAPSSHLRQGKKEIEPPELQ